MLLIRSSLSPRSPQPTPPPLFPPSLASGDGEAMLKARRDGAERHARDRATSARTSASGERERGEYLGSGVGCEGRVAGGGESRGQVEKRTNGHHHGPMWSILYIMDHPCRSAMVPIEGECTLGLCAMQETDRSPVLRHLEAPMGNKFTCKAVSPSSNLQ